MTDKQQLAVAVAALAVSQDIEAIAYHQERTRGPPPIDQRD